MRLRTLNMGAAPPPLIPRGLVPAMFHQHFQHRPQPNPFSAYEYAATTLAVQKHSLSGSGQLFKTGAPLGFGQKPMYAQPTVRPVGLPTQAGQMFFTPLSDPKDKA